MVVKKLISGLIALTMTLGVITTAGVGVAYADTEGKVTSSQTVQYDAKYGDKVSIKTPTKGRMLSKADGEAVLADRVEALTKSVISLSDRVLGVQTAYADWWNPLTWFKKGKKDTRKNTKKTKKGKKTEKSSPSDSSNSRDSADNDSNRDSASADNNATDSNTNSASTDSSSDEDSSTTEAPATSDTAMNRATQMINLAKGGKYKAASKESELTNDDWKVYGWMLSNWFTPFATDVSGNVTDGESDTKALYDKLVAQLTDNNSFGMDKTVAQGIVKGIISSASNGSELHFAYCKITDSRHISQEDFNKNANKSCIYDDKGEEPVTYYSLLAAATGSLPRMAYNAEINNNDKVAKTKLRKAIQGYPTDAPAKNLVVAYNVQNGKKYPQFEADMLGESITPDVANLYNILQASDINEGYGTSVLDYASAKKDQAKGDLGKFKGIYSKLNDASKEYATFLGARLYVDSFGDIIRHGAWTKVVVIPGATNTHVIMPVAKDGKDAPKYRGAAQFLVNSWGILGLTSTGIYGGDTQDGFKRWADANRSGSKIFRGEAWTPSVKLLTQPPALTDNGGAGLHGGEGGTEIGSAYFGPMGLAKFFRGYSNDTLADNGGRWLWLLSNDGSEGTKELYSSMNLFMKNHPSSIMVAGRIARTIIWNWDKGDKHTNMRAQVGIPWGNTNTKLGWGAAAVDSYNGPTRNLNAPMLSSMLFMDTAGLQGYGSEAGNKQQVADDNNTNPDGTSQNKNNSVPQVKFTQYPTCSIIAVMKGNTNGCDTKGISSDSLKSVVKQEIGGKKYANGTMFDVSGINSQVLGALIVTMVGASGAASNTTHKALGWRLDFDGTPDPKFDMDILNTSDTTADSQMVDIRNWLWYLLNPTEGPRYVATLFTKWLSSLFVSWHNDMLGTQGVGILPGSTKYTGFGGYVTVPTLSDLSWTAKMVQWYNAHLLYIILIVLLILVCFVVANVMTISRALISFIAFIVVSLLPAGAINSTINVGNAISNRVYTSKFNYWAVVQNEAYTKALEKAASNATQNGKVTGEYLNSLYGMASSDSGVKNGRGTGIKSSQKGNTTFDVNSQGANNILVKWQAPKKMASITKLVGQSDSDNLGVDEKSALSSLFNVAANKTTSGEIFTGSDADSYLYRSYTDLGNTSKYMYGGYEGLGSSSAKVPYVQTPDTSWWNNKKAAQLFANRSQDYAQRLQNGYNTTGTSQTSDMPFTYTAPFGSSLYKNGIAGGSNTVTDLNKADANTKLGINTDCFGFGITMFTQYQTATKETDADNSSTGMTFKNMKGCSTEQPATTSGKGASEADFGSLAAYAVMSESPYYWAAWTMYGQGMSADSTSASSNGASGSYKDLILNGDGTGYFYNSKNNESATAVNASNGELRDYLDMAGLFKYMMPYMRMGNQLVVQYMKEYGGNFYQGISTAEGQEASYKDDPVALSKYRHNMRLMHLYEIYSPWVDIIDDSSFGQPTIVKVNGKNETVMNPLDPTTYPEDRPMVFSRSEQADYGLRDDQLTKAERAIMKTQEDTEKDMVHLMNYYTFSDSTMVNAAAMAFTFNFNRNFSDQGILGVKSSGSVLYPQNYELKDFSYDMFLRMILSSSTGTSMIDDKGTSTSNTGMGFYGTMVENSSFTTALLYIILDVVAIYIIPFVKLFFIVALFLYLIALALSAVLNVDEGVAKKFGRSAVKPILLFMVVSIASAVVISLFMGNGENLVTGDEGFVIKLGDPAMTLLALVAINVVIAFAYIKLSITLAKDLKNTSKNVGISIAGAVGGAVQAISGGLTAMFKGESFKKGFNQSRGASSHGGASAGAVSNTARAAARGATASGRTAVVMAKKQLNNANKLRNKMVRRAKMAKAESKQAKSGESEKVAERAVAEKAVADKAESRSEKMESKVAERNSAKDFE